MTGDKWGQEPSQEPLPERERSTSPEAVYVGSKHGADRVLATFDRHKRRGGRIYMIAGPSGHGKSVFTWRLKQVFTHQKYRQFSPAQDKTQGGYINVMDIPGHPIVFDIAGEDFERLADKESFDRSHDYFGHFLWHVLRFVDGLILYTSFPAFWLEYNQAIRPTDGPARGDALPAALDAAEREEDAEEAFQRLIEIASLARDMVRLHRKAPRHFPSDTIPPYDDIGAKAQQAARLDIPIFVALGEADVFDHPLWPEGMVPPPKDGVGQIGVHVTPTAVHAAAVIRMRMEHLYEEILSRRLRHLSFGYVQSLDGSKEMENPIELSVEKASLESLIGAEAVVNFLDSFPWRFLPPFASARILHRLRVRRDGADGWGTE